MRAHVGPSSLLAEATRAAPSCLHGVPGGEPQTVASFDGETQNPSGPRQPGTNVHVLFTLWKALNSSRL